LNNQNKILIFVRINKQLTYSSPLIPVKNPSECSTKEEIREQIDRIDQEIIALFGLRFKYVSEIVKFKTDPKSVVAKHRKDHVIKVRGEWAEKHGLDKDTFEQIYRFLVDHNIGKELEMLEKRLIG
jgi:isochorismate pyruvate lyase